MARQWGSRHAGKDRRRRRHRGGSASAAYAYSQDGCAALASVDRVADHQYHRRAPLADCAADCQQSPLAVPGCPYLLACCHLRELRPVRAAQYNHGSRSLRRRAFRSPARSFSSSRWTSPIAGSSRSEAIRCVRPWSSSAGLERRIRSQLLKPKPPCSASQFASKRRRVSATAIINYHTHGLNRPFNKICRGFGSGKRQPIAERHRDLAYALQQTVEERSFTSFGRSRQSTRAATYPDRRRSTERQRAHSQRDRPSFGLGAALRVQLGRPAR